MNFSNVVYHVSSICGQLLSGSQVRLNSSSLVSAAHFNSCIKSLVESSESSFLLGRLGATESRLLRAFYTGFGKDSSHLARHAALTAGIGPSWELGDVARIYLDSLLDFNFLAEWTCPGHSVMKDYLKKNHSIPFYYNLEYLNPLSLCLVFGISPSNLWLSSLKGKRVLVVHPFEQSFRASTTRSLGEFENRLLPEINYHCLVPPVTFGSCKQDFSFTTLLKKSYVDLAKIAERSTFDVALVAAGGYGMPIASYIYRQKIARKVLHVGGVLQLYFGVIGSRWLSHPYNRMYSSYSNLAKWSRVIDSSVIELAKSVESGCYI